MSDSESDTSNNVFTFQNMNTTVSAKGPNTNITMNMPRNFERQRYAESVYDQRSMYYRRETSPMSIHSACDIRPRNFQQNSHWMSSQRSMFNGRSGSPVSMRSINSNASVSAADIALAFKNVKFNKYDLKVIKDAYHKLMKQRVRKKIEKKRNRRLFLKGSRRRSGDDSGDQASNSSISSDDCRSVKTSYKENMFSNRSARIDLTDLRNSILLKDCSDNFKQHTFKNSFSVNSSSTNVMQKFNNTSISKEYNPMAFQKDRFQNGFLLPSQRFNRSVASTAIPENSERSHKNTENNLFNSVNNHYVQNNNNKNRNCESGSEEEIFPEITGRERMHAAELQGKRGLDSDDDTSLPNKKKSKISSPMNVQKNNKVKPKVKIDNPSNNDIESSKQFEFAKPTMPVRKSKSKVTEQLIAKSAQPLVGFLEAIPNKTQSNVKLIQPSKVQVEASNNQIQNDSTDTAQNSDISMRPSFIKRKLFTQKLDVAEKANISSDSINSPQNNAYLLQKEKNKTRKLVSKQSCLNREVQDDSNLLDLIHKIVPPDQMNVTNQTTVINQTKTDVSNKNKKDSEDKWDVTSVLSICHEDDVSDTYTDEEIFEGDNTKKNNEGIPKVNPKTTDKKPMKKEQISKTCKVVLEKLPDKNSLQNQINLRNIDLTYNNITKNCVKGSAKSFWDTDFESDDERLTRLPQSHDNNNIKANATLDATKQDFKSPVDYARSEVPTKSLQISNISKQLNNTTMNNNNTVIKNTFDSMRKFNTSSLTFKSHRTTKKKCCNEMSVRETKTKPDNQNKIPVDSKKENNIGPNIKTVEKKPSKSDNHNKKVLETSKTKSNTQNEKYQNKKTTSHSQNNSPKDKKTKINKQVETNSDSKCKPEKQNMSSANKKRAEKQTEGTKDKNDPKSNTRNNSQKTKKDTQNKTPKTKPKSKTNRQNSSMRSKKDHPVSQTSKSKLNSTVESIPKSAIRSERPVRSCRTPSQNRTTELSRSSQLNNTSDDYKSLRSRVINLSSSIENITIQIKPRRNKTINNKSISQLNNRKSDVSFSL